jgi:hypothetical protein
VQETITNAIANLFGSKAAVFIAIAAVGALALGAEQILSVFDVGVPWRQLMVGRTLHTVTLSCRFFYAIADSYLNIRRGFCNSDNVAGAFLTDPMHQ